MKERGKRERKRKAWKNGRDDSLIDQRMESRKWRKKRRIFVLFSIFIPSLPPCLPFPLSVLKKGWKEGMEEWRMGKERKEDWDSCSSYHSLNEMNGRLERGGEKEKKYFAGVNWWWFIDEEKEEEKRRCCCLRYFDGEGRRKWGRKWGRIRKDIKLTRSERVKRETREEEEAYPWTKGVNRQETERERERNGKKRREGKRERNKR